jgi:hypothetical protein
LPLPSGQVWMVFASDVKLLFPGAELDRGDAAQ